VIEEEPSPYVEYSYYNVNTGNYDTYEPSPVLWTDFYESPSVPIYTYDDVWCNYSPVEEPSPFEEYSYYYEPTDSYVAYVPTAPVWEDYYEPSVESLYTFNEYTGEYEVESSPSPYQEYFTFNPSTGTYAYYEPSPAVWSNYYSVPSVDLYYYDVPTNSYFVEEEPSPYSTYYAYDISTGSVLTYEPAPNAPAEPWTNYYELPPVDLYTQSECTGEYEVVAEPSPFETYFYQASTYEPIENSVQTVTQWISAASESSPVFVFSPTEDTFVTATSFNPAQTYY
jgi:hypothetical protein